MSAAGEGSAGCDSTRWSVADVASAVVVSTSVGWLLVAARLAERRVRGARVGAADAAGAVSVAVDASGADRVTGEASAAAGACRVGALAADGRRAASMAATRSLLRILPAGMPIELARACSSGSSMADSEPERRRARSWLAVGAPVLSVLGRTLSWSWVSVTVLSDPSEWSPVA